LQYGNYKSEKSFQKFAYFKKKQYLCSRFLRTLSATGCQQSEKIMSEDQKCHIIKAAGDLFFRLGIRSVSIDDICHELGISKKTFYVYFASKDELIEQLLQANLGYMRGKMEDLLNLHDFRQLVKVFLKHQEAEKNDVRRVPQLVYDLKKYYPRQFSDFQVQCFETQKEYLKRYLELGVSEGLVRANLNIELTAVLFAKIHNDAIRDFEEIEKHNHNLHQLAHTAMDVFVRGILSEEGLKLYN
jgi:AcrR family transcriptional regulator